MRWLILFIVCNFPLPTIHQPPSTWDFDAQLQRYFESAVSKVKENADWNSWTTQEELDLVQGRLRRELWQMLGLWPIPEKSPLQVEITGTEEKEDFIIEKIVFQSRPGLYVTGNLYRPKRVTGRLPAILYVCGHASVTKDGYNYGAKVHYQHHPAWYAQHGYICLVVDTLQLGEIEGIHHGLYRYDRWWWISRGYTPAGVEAWNGIRAMDYLLSRPDVDPDRLGVTGRSGGGATSWWVGALDDRIDVVVPVAGITDLQNHILDGCVEDHCDCMYFNNSYQWDYPLLGLLIAPRPLLIANADRDDLFPVDGVFRTYQKIRSAYDRLGKGDDLALNIVGGGHHDIPDIQVPTLRWFNHYLQGTDSIMDMRMPQYCTPEELRVLPGRPADEVNTRVDEMFVPLAASALDQIQEQGWEHCQEAWMKQLKEDVFKAWPASWSPTWLNIGTQELGPYHVELKAMRTDPYTTLPVWLIERKTGATKPPQVRVLDEETWSRWADFLEPTLDADNAGVVIENGAWPAELEETDRLILLPMRGVGPARYTGEQTKQTHIKRRFYLLGTSLEVMQTWDLLQGLQVLSTEMSEINAVSAQGNTGVILTYASLFTDHFQLTLEQIPVSHQNGPSYPEVLKYMDVPAAILMSANQNTMVIQTKDSNFWEPYAEKARQNGGNLNINE